MFAKPIPVYKISFGSNCRITTEQMQETYQELIFGSPRMISPVHLSPQMQTMYFNSPTNMQTQINRYTSEAQALVKEPTKLLTHNNPHLIYLLQNSETILESLNQIVSLYQQESEAKIP